MNNLAKFGLYLILLTFWVVSVNARLLVLNRINNQSDKSVKVEVSNLYPNPIKFSSIIKPHQNITFPWGNVWLANTELQSGESLVGNGNLLINNNKYYYTWKIIYPTISGSFRVTLSQQPPVDIGIYPLQGKAWSYLDINSDGIPSIQSGS